MKINILIICFIVDLLICIGIPLGALIYIFIKKRKLVKSYFIGMIVFLISQVFLRLPLINNVLSKFDPYMIFSTIHPVMNAIFLGVTAGLFEEVGRYAGFKFALKNNRSFEDGIAFGIGHGGIEAVIIGGTAAVQNLAALLYLKSGDTSKVIFSMSKDQLIKVFEQANISDALFIGVERLFAMGIHIGLTMMILYGINQLKRKYLYLAIGLHALIDSSVGILQCLGATNLIIEVVIAVSSILLIFYVIKLKNKFIEVN